MHAFEAEWEEEDFAIDGENRDSTLSLPLRESTDNNRGFHDELEKVELSKFHDTAATIPANGPQGMLIRYAK